jgi:hypothetical protein
MSKGTPAGKLVRSAKFTLVDGDPLIDVLKPELVNVVPANYLSGKSSNIDGKDDPEDPFDPDDPEDPEDPGDESKLKAPNLSDITILKKEKVRDGNGNDFVRFTINVKNHVGDAVVGVKVYGQ